MLEFKIYCTRFPPMESGLLTRVMVLVTPPTIVVTTWACWATVTVPDLCTVMMGRAPVVGLDTVGVPTCAAAVFSMRVAGLLTYDKKIVMRLGLANMTADEQRDKLPHKHRIQLMCGNILANATVLNSAHLIEALQFWVCFFFNSSIT